MAIAALIVFGAALVVAILIGLLLAVVLFALVAAGMVSTTLLVGFARRSYGAAFKALLYQIAALAGGAFGAALAIVLRWIFHKSWPFMPTLFSGMTGGLTAGLLLAALIIAAAHRLHRVLTRPK